LTETNTVYTGTTIETTELSTPLLAECPTKVPTPWFGTLDAATGSHVTICLQLYEFNSTSPVLLNSTQILRIYGFSLQGGSAFIGAGNFTVIPSATQFSIGGPRNENEGIILEYSITAKTGASGTYHVELYGMLLAGSQPEVCTGGAGDLVAESGRPNYATPGSCVIGLGPSEGAFVVPGVNYGVAGNELYYRIVGVGNSTA